MDQADIFCKNLEDLLPSLNAKKFNVTYNLVRSFAKNKHYITKPAMKSSNGGRGGHNRVDYFLTEEAYELLKNSYNLKHRYVRKITSTSEHVNVVMSIENQTIGFLENSFTNVFALKRQHRVGSYYADLFLTDHNLAIECDEYGHKDRDEIYERSRELFFLQNKITIIRYNPNAEGFDLSLVLRQILSLIQKPLEFAQVINVEF